MDLLKKILDKLEIALFVIDKNFFIIYGNKKAEELFGPVLNKTCYFLFYKNSEPCPNCIKNQISQNKPKISLTYSLDDKLFLMEYIYLSDEQTLILLKDISDESYYKKTVFNILEILPILVFFIKKGKIIYVNNFVEKSLGYSKQELLEENFIEKLVFSKEKFNVEKIFNEILVKRKKERHAFFLIDKEGKSRLQFGEIGILKDIDNEDMIILAGIDVTEFFELRQTLENIHKIQSFVTFLRSLVHDFNNVLCQVESNLKIMERYIEDPPKIKKYINIVNKTLSSWIDINRLLLDYTKEFEEIKVKKVEMINFLKENLELFQLIAGSQISIKLDFDYLSSVWVTGDESFWRYIFLNFISNAKDAIEGEGNISIILKTIKEEDKKYLIILIKDTGCGIPPEYIERIFDPFFTTKEKSSGLGLFLVKNHITNIGGKIEVESEVNKGTTFKIYVPIIEIKKVIKEERKPEDVYIVIVEDEEIIRKNLEEILKIEGYNVYSFSSGRELKENISQIEKADILICDFHLPDMKGGEVYQILKKEFPDVDVIFLTGDIFSIADLPSHRVLLKPFSVESLLQKIKTLL